MNGHHSWPRAVTHCRVRSMGGLRERGSLVRRDGDALGASLDELGHVLVVILANNMTARQALRLGDITLRLKQAICCDFFRSFVTNHPPPTLHLHPSSTVSSPYASSRDISYHSGCNFIIKSPRIFLFRIVSPMARWGRGGMRCGKAPARSVGREFLPGHDAPDPLRRDNSRPSPHTRRVGALTYPRSIRNSLHNGATLTGADRSFPARGPRLWPCVGSGRPDFRHGFWR